MPLVSISSRLRAYVQNSLHASALFIQSFFIFVAYQYNIIIHRMTILLEYFVRIQMHVDL